MRRVIYLVVLIGVLGHLDLTAQVYDCDPNFPNNDVVWLTEFNISAQDPSGMITTDAIELTLTNEDDCFFYTADTLNYFNQITFDFQHNLTMGEKVYAKIWFDLNQDGFVTDDETVFTDSTTTTEFSGLFTLPTTLGQDEFQGTLRVAVAPTLEEVDDNNQLFMILEQERPKVTVASSPTINSFGVECIELTNPLTFEVVNGDPSLDFNLTNIKLSITDRQGISNNNVSVITDIIDPVTGSGTLFTPTLLRSGHMLKVGIDLQDASSVVNPANLGLTEIELSIEIDSNVYCNLQYFLGCCESGNVIYNTSTNASNQTTWLPYHKAASDITVGNAAITAYAAQEEVYLKAENYIQLKPGVHFEAGVTSRLFIAPCVDPSPLQEEVVAALITESSIDEQVTILENKTIEKPRDEAVTLKCFPNPFQDNRKIEYEIPESAAVSLILYDILGNPLQVLIDHQTQTKGQYETNLYSGGLPSGVYFLSLQVDEEISFLKLIKS